MNKMKRYLNPYDYINIYTELWYSIDSMFSSHRKPVYAMDDNELKWRLNLAKKHKSTNAISPTDSDSLIEMLTWWIGLAQETKELIRLVEILKPRA